MKVRVIQFLIFLFVCFSFAQKKQIKLSNQRIESFDSEQGFFQNTVHAIVSDANGYLWVATPNGLVRYDGYSFDYYYHNIGDKNSLPNNFISSLLTDSKGRLWIGTRGGVSIYLADKELFLPVENSIQKDVFIKEDDQNRIWIGGSHKIQIYDTASEDLQVTSKLGEIDLANVLDVSFITDLEFLSKSELLVSTSDKIFKVDVNENENYSVGILELALDASISNIKEILKVNNSIWIGTFSGLYQTFYENGKLLTIGGYFDENDKSSNSIKGNIQSLYLDKNKVLWVGTRNYGAIKYDPKNEEFTSFQYDSKYKNGLTSNRVNCFYEDNFGVLWIGTAQGGLNKFDKNLKDFQNYSHNAFDDQSLSSNLITDLVEGKDGKIWVSFFRSEISQSAAPLNLESGKRVSFNRIDGALQQLENDWVITLFQDLKGYWWIGTNTGVYLYDESQARLKQVDLKNDGASESLIFSRVIQQIGDNKMLLAGPKVFLLDHPWDNILNDKPVEVQSELFDIGKNNQINDYKKDSFGNHWFASILGLYRVKVENNTWQVKDHLTSTNEKENLALSYDYIFNIHVASNKTVWLGTYGGGLMKVNLNAAGNPENIKGFHRNDGLRDEVIYGILEDDEGMLWMSTDMGIGFLNPKDEVFNFYDVNDGVLSNNFRQSAFLKTKKGMMLMGGVDGLTIFDPKQIVKNVNAPKVLISELKINNEPVISGKKINGKVILNQSITDTNELDIDHDNRNLSLDIIVQHSATPNKNKVAYKLVGVNQDWIEVDGGKTTATYTNLSPGTYDFLYKGANGDGLWTPETHFKINVLSPWYLKWWSIALWLALGLLLAHSIMKYLVRLEKLNQKLKFEQLEKERVRDMNQAKLRFFTNISHDFKTPLSLIIGPFEKIADQYKKDDNQKYFSIIQNNILRLQRLIDQLISYRKAETGHLELQYSKVTLGNFMYPLMEGFEDYAQRSLLNFYYKVDDPNKLITIDIDKTERILLNLFSNAVKYSGSYNEISIEAGIITQNNEEVLSLRVHNTGGEISPEKIERIFDRFYRGVDEKQDWNGTGIGLALCKSLVDLMKGTISVTSEVDKKTEFVITLPITNKGAQLEEIDVQKHYKNVTDWLPSELESIQDRPVDASLPTLLIIDDEQDIRSFLYEAFKEKYNIVLAVNGEEGLEKLKENTPQLVISDVMMPKMDGYELCKAIKSNTEFCHIPVILLTAIGDNFKKLEGLELGADDYIVKPFSIKYLEVRVKKLIENKQHIFDYYSRNSFMPKESLISSSKDKEFLESINRSIEENMSNSVFGVEELASDIGMSTSHFYRKLKELTGQAPNFYLRNFRLQKAAELLTANKNLTAADVMFEIGIESKSYYSSAFKKIHGVSPSEYVKKL
ncbi:two-component regulator propeller domain-containing protein [Tamlana sp. 1_MG-2023]|uniref:hybrid sensor histidine kinase/response regulator transcription factor n=1 Tax=Tamlana sp. 1_MG-2023 TaxID=3062628 RepID=UPI0026E45CB4|nr:two-component regulator propeller domain-containing protein [Tamlana sp. 1_MG-2023]MDO6792061.1 two-component regulator propeller domain-containing protein [Tamlana sp. 1_MG-2023]